MTKRDRTGVPPAVRDLLERLNQGFARRDVQLVLSLFAPGPEIMFIGSEPGEVAAGPEQLRNLLAGLFARGEIYQWRWEELRLSVAGDVAWLVAQAVLVVEGPEPLELPYRITLVLQRCNATWLIAHYHGSEPAAGPGHEAAGPGHEAAGPGHEAAGPGHEAAGAGHEAAGPGHEAAGPGHEAAGPGHEAAGPGHEAAGPGHEAAGAGLEAAAEHAHGAAGAGHEAAGEPSGTRRSLSA